MEKASQSPQPAEPVDTDLVQRWQREHGVVLTPGTREAAMVVIRHDEDGKPTVWCDPEIADLVRALNGGGVATVASCSGHGHRPGNIMLADGRVLVVCKDADESREVESHFPGINGEAPLAAEPVKVPSMRDLIADDAYAATFQSVGQYRKALLAGYRNSDIGQSAEQLDYASAAKVCRSVGANSFAECFERAAQHKAAKCDGDHGGPRCADPECWNDSSD